MQNRPVCEVFTPQGALSDIGTNHSKMVRREYNKLLRCSVLVLEGDSTRVSLPRSQKVPGLRLSHPILALQLIAPTGSTCLDLVLEDTSGLKSGASSRKRITFNMQRQQAVIQGDVAKLPFSLPRDTWMLLCIDLVCGSCLLDTRVMLVVRNSCKTNNTASTAIGLLWSE